MRPHAFFFLAVLAPLTAARADAPLTWDACVDQTLKANPALRAAAETVHSSEFQAKQTLAPFLPQVSGALTYGRDSTAPTTDGYGATLTASQNLFNGLADKGRMDQADAQVRVQQASRASTEAQVAFDLKTSYAGLLYAQHSVSLQQKIVKRREDNLKLVGLRFEGGRENRGSVLLSQAYLGQARFDALQAKDGILVAQSQLAAVLGRGDPENLSVGEDIPLETPPSSPDYQALSILTPGHLRSAALEDSADAAVTVARAGFFPTLNLTATAGRNGTTFFPQEQRWSVGASLTFPLFSGGKDYFGTRSASAAHAAASSQLEVTDRETLTDLRTAYTGYVEAVEKLKVDEAFQEAAIKRAEIARQKYNNGLMTFEDWDVIENDLINRERAVLQSQRARTAAEAAWRQAQGKGVTP
ncbi:MAG TPA: TolC family protein [Bdellovibrionota bacterium]|jgi:outer membrane protein TolC|nr:TolC family protein [Bdellovibrionota bacterium]